MHIRTSHVPKELQQITREGVKFFCENFLHRRTFAKIELIKISFISEPKSTELAWCGPAVYDDVPRLSEFFIDYNNKYLDMRVREYMTTLFHELTHMRQYATGQLKYLSNGTTKWKGKVYPDTTEYWLQPWEVEAQGLEQSCYQLFAAKFPGYGLKRYKTKYNGRHKTRWTGEKG